MFEKMASADRIKLAQAHMEKVLNSFLYLQKIHANNKFVVHSPTLSRQIPTSFAASAFNVFQRSMYQIEIVRLCTLWDGADASKENIPTVIELIDDKKVIDELVAKARAHYRAVDFGGKGITPEEAKAIATRWGIREAKRAKAQLKGAIIAARTIMALPSLAAVMNVRDKHIAHSLAETRREKKGPVPIMKNRDGRDLLKKSISIVERLHRWVSGKGFSIKDSQKLTRKMLERFGRVVR